MESGFKPRLWRPVVLTRITAVVTLFSLYSAYHPSPTARVIHVYEIVCPQFSEPSSGSHLTQEKPGAHSGPQAPMIEPCSFSAGTSCHLPIPLPFQPHWAPCSFSCLEHASLSPWLLSPVPVSWLILFSREQST